eukprot:1330437-Amphidinium_carterae.2
MCFEETAEGSLAQPHSGLEASTALLVYKSRKRVQVKTPWRKTSKAQHAKAVFEHNILWRDVTGCLQSGDASR